MKEIDNEKDYKIPEYPNKEKGFFMDEEKFGEFSKNLFKIPIFGYITAIILNLIYISNWRKKSSISSMIITFCINYLIIQIILGKLLNSKEEK